MLEARWAKRRRPRRSASPPTSRNPNSSAAPQRPKWPPKQDVFYVKALKDAKVCKDVKWEKHGTVDCATVLPYLTYRDQIWLLALPATPCLGCILHCSFVVDSCTQNKVAIPCKQWESQNLWRNLEQIPHHILIFSNPFRGKLKSTWSCLGSFNHHCHIVFDALSSMGQDRTIFLQCIQYQAMIVLQRWGCKCKRLGFIFKSHRHQIHILLHIFWKKFQSFPTNLLCLKCEINISHQLWKFYGHLLQHRLWNC